MAARGRNSPSMTRSPGPTNYKPSSPRMSPRHALLASPSPSTSTSSTKAASLQRVVEDMRQHIAALKLDLDAEKMHSKQIHRDKMAELKSVKEKLERDKDEAIRVLQLKLKQERAMDAKKTKEAAQREKDNEIRQMARVKEEEIKQIKIQMQHEKETAMTMAFEMNKKSAAEHEQTNRPSSGSNSALIVRLQREVKALKDTKRQLEEDVLKKAAEETTRKNEMARMLEEHETEICQLTKKLIEKDKAESLKTAEIFETKNGSIEAMTEKTSFTTTTTPNNNDVNKTSSMITFVTLEENSGDCKPEKQLLSSDNNDTEIDSRKVSEDRKKKKVPTATLR